MLRLAGTTALLALWAGAAAADCPVSMADSAAGLYVEFDGYVVRYDRRPDGTVEELEFPGGDASGFRYISQHGIFVLESWESVSGRVIAGTHETITYATPLPATITPNMSYESATHVFYGADAPVDEPVAMTTGAGSTIGFGDCSLSTIPVEMRTGPVGQQDLSTFTYFPQLGFAVFTGGGAVGGQQDSFPILNISADPPELTEAAGGTDLLPPPPPAAPPAAPPPAQPTK
ncbi:hypothetical protein HKCCE3408_17975 [Rhodobacterales bacterium HKCCE3408]|nr:hypothetical protein [Rhodobacterales bacterium HKCCE3408]